MEITDIVQLREIIAEPSPGLEAKNIPYLDTFACDFISKSPFIILSTSDEEGRCDGSPKGCLLYTSPSPRDLSTSRMPSSA